MERKTSGLTRQPGCLGAVARFWRRSYAADYIALATILCAWLMIQLFVPPFHRMFSLDNRSIQYPFAEQERVPVGWAIIYSAALPLVTIALWSAIFRPEPHFAHATILGLLATLIVTTFITDLIKNAVGRPRPDLLSRCSPEKGTPEHTLVSFSVCSSPDGHILREGWRSFPSGHSSFAFGGLGYLALFFAGQLKVCRPRSGLSRALFSLSPLLGALMIALSRLEDYRHDVYDIACGSILGFAIAYLIYRCYYPSLCASKPDDPYRPSDQEQSSGFRRVIPDEEQPLYEQNSSTEQAFQMQNIHHGTRSSVPASTTDAPNSRSSTPVPGYRLNRNDHVQNHAPETPNRIGKPPYGLSLHMPHSVLGSRPSPSFSRIPLSPKLDSSHTFGSPASVLPRRSRGLDFSRACTNLHHSTLAESSPDSSPVVGGRGISIPQRRGTMGSASGIMSPNSMLPHACPSAGYQDRVGISSSVSSVNMLDSDSSNESDDGDDESIHGFEHPDPMIMTPQSAKTVCGLSTPFSPGVLRSPVTDWMTEFSAAKASLINFQRARCRSGRKRHSSSSASGPSPHPLSGSRSKSPPGRTTSDGRISASVVQNSAVPDIKSRLELLSQSPGEFHLSDASDDGRGGKHAAISSPSSGSLAGGSNSESGRRGVIRRAVTRRGNLLPKTKNFARIRATLFEEGAPVESEVKREAEVIRQVRESDTPVASLPADSLPAVSQATTAPAPVPESSSVGNRASSFSRHVSENSRGLEFWNTFDGRYTTPPPCSNSDAMVMTPPEQKDSLPLSRLRRSAGAGPDTLLFNPNKRRRGDDFDPASFKRRAVSPGTSSQNSPVQSHASSTKEANRGGQSSRVILLPGSQLGEVSSSSNNGHVGPKRVGLQGMNETNEGLMNMSIE
ncbi:hypothetical protein FQN57_003153 [Myotisia sp. PD_48]|nr:hypothetical protein FQN57_003153 [Myotisia sp. PD_48]